MVTEAEPTKQRVSSYLYLGSLYFVTVGVLYLWGYWSRFNVNILEYISLADVLKFTAYPIASTVLFLILGAAAGELLGVVTRNLLVDRNLIPPGGGRNTEVGRTLSRFGPMLVFAYAAGVGALIVFGPAETNWLILAPFIGIPIGLIAEIRGVLTDIIPHKMARSLVLYFLAVMPIWAYGEGRLKSFMLLEGKEYTYLVSNTTDGIIIGDPDDPKTRIKLIGHANDYVFLLLADNVTLAIIPFDKTRGLQLRRFKSTDLAASEASNNRMQPTPKNGATDAKR